MTDTRITRDEVARVARLARLALSDDELNALRDDLDAILGYVAKLSELDVSEVEPTTHAIPLEMPTRRDEVVQTLSRDEVLSNAPSAEDGMFKVPTILEGGN
ncbi:MAG: Asp-tRNA(Asn)/Glu-tRNA(Gln) amidotransferase GatCAB subunit C [Myxococcales bacterium]|nr:Asp-tRNA(Asn)/Glu-tRNA(Gln) amidotransferase GatCAB subunit C [Myxococcales bacterium]